MNELLFTSLWLDWEQDTQETPSRLSQSYGGQSIDAKNSKTEKYDGKNEGPCH
jgi:hypothetical protein